jgi:acyl CoA:acetate/3-ketoacid CoA transferase beta subunit
MKEMLIIPKGSYAISSEEMTYIDGGRTATIHDSLGGIRTRLNTLWNQAAAGAAMGSVAGVLGAKTIVIGIAGIVVAGWHSNVMSHASSGHHQVTQLIARHGTARRGTMTSTWNWVGWMTGITVRA